MGISESSRSCGRHSSLYRRRGAADVGRIWTRFSSRDEHRRGHLRRRSRRVVDDERRDGVRQQLYVFVLARACSAFCSAIWCGKRSSRRGPSAATSWRRCWGAAGWAKSGALAIACWPGGQPSSRDRPIRSQVARNRWQTAMTRFEREAQATASLRSAHTVELYDFGVSDTGTFYYVIELLEGLDARSSSSATVRCRPSAWSSPNKSATHSARHTLRDSSIATSSRRISSCAGTGARSIS